MAVTSTRALAWVVGGLFVVGASVALYQIDWTPTPTPTPPQVTTTTQPTPATTPATTAPAAAPVTFLDVVRRTDSRFEDIEPQGIPFSLKEAARLIINDPLYVSPDGRLWTVRTDGQPILQILRKIDDATTPVTRDSIVYLHWQMLDDGSFRPIAICQTNAGGYEAVDADGRWPLSREDYRWSRALSWDGRIVVPTGTGVGIIEFKSDLAETHRPLVDEPTGNEVQFLLDWHGLLTWIPWENGKPGSAGAARWINGQWTRLDSSVQWPEKIIHLVPLLDGSVLRLALDEQGKVIPTLAALDVAKVDEGQIEDLVWQLSDPLEEKRIEAFNELTRYGPGLWPIIEKMIPDQPAEAQARLRQLLANKIQPSLGGMTLVDGQLQTVARLDDGGVVFHAPQGVMVPDARGGQPRPEVPAWISIRPGRPIQLLSPYLTADLEPAKDQLITVRNEWIVVDDVLGPQRFMGNHLAPLLRKSERAFRYPVAIDQRGRWLVRQDPRDITPTLVIDPTLPDPTPRLPVWKFTQAQEVGWTEAGWPVTKRGGTWVLEADGWRPLDEKKKEKMLTEAPPEPEIGVATPTTTQATSQPAEPPLLTTPDGTRYFGGQTDLRVINSAGNETIWPLPGQATGSLERPALFRISDGTLFLFNEPGRLIRIKPTPTASEPFRLERVFTRDIPNVVPRRIWMDPAERILIVAGTGQLSILFPSGRVPAKIQTLMPAQDDDVDDLNETTE